ncbi:MAG: 1,2-phenylacetyl-CoA epoxidase, subunit E [Ignavibacteria bacterium]|nr:1,2-phenylacetyl-CoA epoxidase, subunit E [Ignavibacteria bacterium]
MSFKTFPIKVIKKEYLTNEAVAVYFDIPENLKDVFKYKPGQFVTLKLYIDGKEHRREYSLCSSPYTDKDFVIASKRVNNGTVSNYLYFNLYEGDVIDVSPPKGNFYSDLISKNSKQYVLIGGGSGITPLFSILKSVLFIEPDSNVILYYGNQSEENIMFRKELEMFCHSHGSKLKILYTLIFPSKNWNYLTGNINKNDLINILSDNQISDSIEREFYICGPEKMMNLVKETLTDLKVRDENIHIEYFNAPSKHHEFIPEASISEELKERTVTVLLDGNEHEIKVPPDSSILNSAINADLDPPFSCKSGICTTCRAKLLSGKVKMDEREGLSDSEIEQGYILTCQSHPLTDDVKIEYM